MKQLGILISKQESRDSFKWVFIEKGYRNDVAEIKRFSLMKKMNDVLAEISKQSQLCVQITAKSVYIPAWEYISFVQERIFTPNWTFQSLNFPGRCSFIRRAFHSGK